VADVFGHVGSEAAPEKGSSPLVTLPDLKAGTQLHATVPPAVAAKETKPPSYVRASLFLRDFSRLKLICFSVCSTRKRVFCI
jgi:hypothetical protein